MYLNEYRSINFILVNFESEYSINYIPMIEKILITGASGFIGYHIIDRLLTEGFLVYGIDGMFRFGRYDLLLKKRRLEMLKRHINSRNFIFTKDRVNYNSLLKAGEVDCIIHLAGVSGIERFETTQDTSRKITIEAAEGVLRYAQERDIPVIYASSSSIYGRVNIRRFSEGIPNLRPVSSYAKTRLDIERRFLDAKVRSIGLRLFTVYGEYGRPDMSYFIFADRIFNNKNLYIYGKGIRRDFTYVKDVVESVFRLVRKRNDILKRTDKLILNVGRGEAVPLEDVVGIIADLLGKKPRVLYREERAFDTRYTCADNSLLKKITGYKPQTDIKDGLKRFVQWYKDIFIKQIKK